MIELKTGAGLVVAGDLRNAFSAVDDALLNSARMCVSVLEATQGANIPAAESHKLLRSLTASMTAVVDGRDEIVSALKQMLVIKGQSNLAAVSYGCPDGWTTTGQASQARSVAEMRAPPSQWLPEPSIACS